MKKPVKPFIEKLLNDDSFINWAKETNTNDISYWNSWIDKNPEKIDDIYIAKAMLLGVAFNKNTLTDYKINKELSAVLNRLEFPNSNAKKTTNKLFNFSKYQKYAAVAAIGLIIIVLGFNALNQSLIVSHQTAYGEILNLKLPDGSTVVLNGNSSIEYKKDKPRNINLTGEAYFTVKSIPSTKAKFWVNTNDMTIEVFGTQFNVNTRKDKTSVLLDEGSIHLLLKNGESKKMNPGEVVSFSKENKELLHKKITTTTSYSSWKEGTYIFNNLSLNEVMQHIENTYGIPYEFVDKKLKNMEVSGGIPNENLDICLKAIQKSTEVKIITKEDKLYIYN